MQDIVSTKYGKVDLNKLRKPVLRIAIKKAKKERKRLKERVERLEDRLLPVEDESEERFRRAEEYDKAYCQLEEYDYDSIFTLKRLGIKCNRGNKLLALLSRNYLNVNPKYGIKFIVEAYNEYYNIGQKCAHCGNTIPPATKQGRTKKYCSRACKQKAYRERKKNNDTTDNDDSPITSEY